MPKRYKKQSKASKILITIITISVIILILFYVYNIYQGIEIYDEKYESKKTISTVNEQTVDNEMKKSKNVSDILEETMKCVVGISKIKNNGTSIFTNNDESSLGLGTGIIILKNGYILSNEHVTGGRLSSCYVTLEDGNQFKGTVMWSDSDLDLSIVKIDVEKLPAVTLGDSNNIRTGEMVYAIGNPIGFEFRRTVTSGIISSTNRTIKIEEDENATYMSNLIQTDATINPGNSGGPLIYANGEVIGINTIKISSAEGIGFAIPINVVKPIIESFKENNTFEQATIGIYAYDKEVIPYLDTNITFTNGIFVAQIIKNGPADKSELKIGDIITSIDGKTINTMNELREYIYSKKPNDIITLQISRRRTNITKNVTLRLKMRQEG